VARLSINTPASQTGCVVQFDVDLQPGGVAGAAACQWGCVHSVPMAARGVVTPACTAAACAQCSRGIQLPPQANTAGRRGRRTAQKSVGVRRERARPAPTLLGLPQPPNAAPPNSGPTLGCGRASGRRAGLPMKHTTKPKPEGGRTCNACRHGSRHARVPTTTKQGEQTAPGPALLALPTRWAHGCGLRCRKTTDFGSRALTGTESVA
jgi:hypothetical protein